jgi:ferredoxin
MVVILHALADRSDRRTLFLHACENGDVHALRDEVADLVARHPNLSSHFCYRTPCAEDRAANRFDSEGFVTREVLQSLLCLDDYDFYVCGPPPFMQAMYQTLRGLGAAKNRIAYEFFGPATVLEAEATPRPAVAEAPLIATGGAITVEFRKSGIVAEWNAGAQSLLSFAEDYGLKPDFSCRAGICGTCTSRKLSGDVRYFDAIGLVADQGRAEPAALADRSCRTGRDGGAAGCVNPRHAAGVPALDAGLQDGAGLLEDPGSGRGARGGARRSPCSGRRLGRGWVPAGVWGGYFDRTLAALDPPAFAIGVGLDAARVPTIYPQPHNIAMDAIVTETGPQVGPKGAISRR